MTDNPRYAKRNALMDKYPDIFRDRYLPMQTTCMCWGLEVGDGWLPIIDMICRNLTRVQTEYGVKVTAQQVKEKFGGLRFYYSMEFGPTWAYWPTWPLAVCDCLRKIPWLYNMRGNPVSRLRDWVEAHTHRLNGTLRVPQSRLRWKSGNIRAYVATQAVDLVSEAVRVGELLADVTCEHCGKIGATPRDDGWRVTLCDACAKERKPANTLDDNDNRED